MSEFEFEDDAGGEWLYVEESYDQADELAEYTCPSPIYIGEDGRSGNDYDMFEYFADLEYLSDGGYFDDDEPKARSGQKRKHGGRPASGKHAKRKKSQVGSAANDDTPVVWMSYEERTASLEETPETSGPGRPKTVALLKDWRTRFEDDQGLASFPQGDFQLDESLDDGNDDDDGEEEADENLQMAGDGFELDNMQQIAGLIGEENMAALQKMMEAQGLDPSAVEQVLQDMIEGRERTFDSQDERDGDEGEDEEDDDADQGGQSQSGTASGHVQREASSRDAGLRVEAQRPGTLSVPRAANGRSAHNEKRKARDGDEQGDDGGQHQRAKRARPGASSNHEDQEVLPPPPADETQRHVSSAAPPKRRRNTRKTEPS